MQIENLQIVQENYDDLRFGPITIYFEPEKELMIMKKTHKAHNTSEFDIFVKQAEARSKLDHKNILKMLCIEADPENLEISSYFEYPNEDLYEKRKNLLEKEGLQKFLENLTESLIFLENKKMIHGNIRPEYIFYDAENNEYVLLDRLADVSPPNLCQLNNFKKKHKLFLHPKIFDEILKDNFTIKHSPYKTEIFALGMLVVNLICGESKVQKVYDRKLRKFDKILFEEILEEFRNGHDGTEQGERVYRVVADHMVSLDSRKILKPKNLRRVLKGHSFGTIEQSGFFLGNGDDGRRRKFTDLNDGKNPGSKIIEEGGKIGNVVPEIDGGDDGMKIEDNNIPKIDKIINNNNGTQIHNNNDPKIHKIINNNNGTQIHNKNDPKIHKIINNNNGAKIIKPPVNPSKQANVISWEEYQKILANNKNIQLRVSTQHKKSKRSYTPNIKKINNNSQKKQKSVSKFNNRNYSNSNFNNNYQNSIYNKNLNNNTNYQNTNFNKNYQNLNNNTNYQNSNNNNFVNSGNFSKSIVVGGKTLYLANVLDGKPIYRYA